MNNELKAVMDLMWKVGTLVIIVVIVINAAPQKYNATRVYRCQGKAYDPHARKALNKMLRVTNASLWEERNI